MKVSFALFLRVAANRQTLLTGLKVASIVGCVLNGINQGDMFIAMRWGEIAWVKVGLTFCVPFCVSVYSATTARLRFDPGTKAFVKTHLLCQHCGKMDQWVEVGDVIVDCSMCKEKTDWRPVES